MRVTVLADASWCPSTGAAGYGYWIASDRGSRGGGNVLSRATTNNDAEMMAVVNTLHIALTAGLIESGDVVLVQTDSSHAISRFTRAGANATSVEREVIAALRWIVREHKLTISYKHVKGHTNRNTHTAARFGANRMCDLRARRYMNEARRRLRQEGK